MRTILLAAASLSLTAMPALADEEKPLSPSQESAVYTTQLLTTAICPGIANLDPKLISMESGAFAFVLALQSVATPNDLAKKSDGLIAHMKEMKCDENGLLQLKSE